MTFVPWIGFVALVIVLLALDLGVLNKHPHAITPKEALRWTAVWVSLGLLFNLAVYFIYEHRFLGIGETIGLPLSGRTAAMQFFTAYVVEESLSIDNLFVMALVFNYFAVPAHYQHRVLFFGILGALVFRGVFIGAGLAFIHLFDWSIYVFGALLVYTAGKMLFAKEGGLEPGNHPLVRAMRRFVPVTNSYHGDRFFVRIDGKRAATPLCVALVLIESSDIVFAVDSVPAVFGVTSDPFIAFTSNVFAILGLRSLYFALAAAMDAFRYMKVSLVLVLGFVGIKMMLPESFTPAWAHGASFSLAVIFVVLGGGVVASLLARRGSSDPDALAASSSSSSSKSNGSRTDSHTDSHTDASS